MYLVVDNELGRKKVTYLCTTCKPINQNTNFIE